MASVRPILATIALMLLGTSSFSVSAAGERFETWDTMSCGSFTFGCKASERVSVTIDSCDEATCTITIDATAVGGANLPGTHQTHIAFAAGDGSGAGFCTGIPELREFYESSCGHVCDGFDVGPQGGCHGVVTVRLELPPGGDQWIDVYTIYGWNGYGGNANPGVWFDFFRDAEGGVEVFACGWYSGCHGSAPPPPPRHRPEPFPPTRP